PDGKVLCASGNTDDAGQLPIIAPGDIRVRVSPDADAIAIRAGVIGGMATAVVPVEELRTAALETGGDIRSLVLHDGNRELRVIDPPGREMNLSRTDWPIGNS